jgi:hypothetical protein
MLPHHRERRITDAISLIQALAHCPKTGPSPIHGLCTGELSQDAMIVRTEQSLPCLLGAMRHNFQVDALRPLTRNAYTIAVVMRERHSDLAIQVIEYLWFA